MVEFSDLWDFFIFFISENTISTFFSFVYLATRACARASRTTSFCALGLILGSSYVVEFLQYFREFWSVIGHHCKYHVKRDIFIEDSRGRYLGMNV